MEAPLHINTSVSDNQLNRASLGFFQKRRARRRFLELAGADRLIDLADWQKAFETRNPLITRRLFQVVDTDGSGYIDENEYFDFVASLLDTVTDRRIRLVFSIYDLDDDGVIEVKDIRQILQASLDEQFLKVETEELAELANGFLRHFKSAGKRALECEDFVAGIQNYKKIDSLFAHFARIWLPSSSGNRSGKSQLRASWRTRTLNRLGEKWQSYFWLVLYVLVNEQLFNHAVNHYAAIGATPAVQLARGFGACLNLNVALVLLPICRAFWTRMRHTIVARLIPVDALTDIHRGIGWVIVAFSLLHAASHTYNYWQTGIPIAVLFRNSAFLTGLLSAVILMLMLWGVSFRFGRNRERFSNTHLFYSIFIISILMHGPMYWMWLFLPALFYFLDALYRYIFKTRSVKVLAMQVLSDGVTLVRFAKPAYFSFYPGDYLRLRIPAISSLEWHPFTISASPEADHFDVHVRNSGDWSGALHNLSRKRGIDPSALRANIDGPYGAPTSSIYRAPVAVMIAGGIGVTPFASALESLVMRGNLDGQSKERPEQQIVYFHWLNRSQLSYGWFKKLLLQAEQNLGDKFRLYIHLTSLSHNLTNIAMQIAVEEFYIKHQRDPFTSLHAITNPGRPHWPELFSDLAKQHSSYPVEVYLCGPPELAKDLRRHCLNYGFYFHEEKFG
jgi:predicted ferric reductase/Ca2+-binding EF-hand superfamily protein